MHVLLLSPWYPSGKTKTPWKFELEIRMPLICFDCITPSFDDTSTYRVMIKFAGYVGFLDLV